MDFYIYLPRVTIWMILSHVRWCLQTTKQTPRPMCSYQAIIAEKNEVGGQSFFSAITSRASQLAPSFESPKYG